MIHQLIFAHPKPGMSEQDFQRYWVEVHAVKFASRIPQIKRYLIDTRVPFGPEPADPLFSGVAEIWMNEEDQMASLQSHEFLEGARRDEPNWAAFWQTLALDTDAHVLVEGEPPSRDSTMVKVITLVKRKEGLPLKEFRLASLDVHGPLVGKLPGLRRYLQGHVRDGMYAVGEASLDCVSQLWFDDLDAIERMYASPEYERVANDLEGLVEPRYIHTMVTREHWVIGPEPR